LFGIPLKKDAGFSLRSRFGEVGQASMTDRDILNNGHVAMNILGHYHFGITYDFVNFIRTFLPDNFQRNLMELTQTMNRNVIF
jgi:hypothetical protein